MGTTGVGTGTPTTPSTRYATVAAWKLWASDNTTYLTNAEGTSLDGVIGYCLDAASRQIDADTGRVFYLTSAEERIFRADDDGTVDVVDLVAGSISAIAYDADSDDESDTDLETTDYICHPLTDERGRAPARYQELRRRKGAANWPSRGAIVAITADWGYVEDDGSPPADIVQACVILAGRLFARREAKLGAIAVPGVGTVGMVKGSDIDYENLIRRYVRSEADASYALT